MFLFERRFLVVEMAFHSAVALLLLVVVAYDLVQRRVPNVLVLVVVALRVGLCAAAFAGLVDWETWCTQALLWSGLSSFVLVGLVVACTWLVARIAKWWSRRRASGKDLVLRQADASNLSSPLGAGDVKLYAACLLWLDPASGFLMLLLSSLFGLVIGVAYWRILGERSFPFVPAIVLSFYVTVLASFVWA